MLGVAAMDESSDGLHSDAIRASSQTDPSIFVPLNTKNLTGFKPITIDEILEIFESSTKLSRNYSKLRETSLVSKRGIDIFSTDMTNLKPAFITSSPVLLKRTNRSICETRIPTTSPLTKSSKRSPRMQQDPLRKCARCGRHFRESENTAKSCYYHGDVLGRVMHLNLYEDHHFDDEALHGVKGPRYGRRWACCQDTDPDAPPCKVGFHVTYDCDEARWREVSFAVK